MNSILYYYPTILANSPGGGGIDQATGQNIADLLRDFIGPILLIVIGIVAVTFLFKRQLTQFFQFMALAILVALLFYTPAVLPAIAGWISQLFGVQGGTDTVQ